MTDEPSSWSGNRSHGRPDSLTKTEVGGSCDAWRVDDVYTHGHHESVLRSHRWRTADNSAGYLLPHLRAGLDVLDLGCGPGTITLDLAARVAPGRVLGIDSSVDVIEQARSSGDGRVAFQVGDVYSVDATDGSFDVVHAHQVLQHLTDPIAAITEAAASCARAGSSPSATATTPGSSGRRPTPASIVGSPCTTS